MCVCVCVWGGGGHAACARLCLHSTRMPQGLIALVCLKYVSKPHSSCMSEGLSICIKASQQFKYVSSLMYVCLCLCMCL